MRKKDRERIRKYRKKLKDAANRQKTPETAEQFQVALEESNRAWKAELRRSAIRISNRRKRKHNKEIRAILNTYVSTDLVQPKYSTIISKSRLKCLP